MGCRVSFGMRALGDLARLIAEDGRSVILAIGLTKDNVCRFKGADGSVRTFAGKEFSCEIIR